MSNLAESIIISFIAISVIFLILTLLIGVIRVMVAWWPYEEPLAPSSPPPGAPPNPEHLAAIHAALAQYLGKTPDEIQLHNIKQL